MLEQDVTEVDDGEDPSPLRLLLVADDVDHSAVVVDLLRGCLPTAEVRVVEDLAAARSALAVAPDLVLADLSLPDADALEVVAALRTACPGTAVVVLCRHDDDGFALRAIAAGADDCLVKGSHDAVVLATVVTRSVERVRAQTARQRREHFAASLLESTESATCAVDRAGRVVSVNAPWRAYAAGNGGDPLSCGVGTDYLASCEDAEGEHVDGAAEVAAGLRGVLDGSLERFEHEYSCHAPGRLQWFSVRITPRADGDGAVISHIDVTTSRLADRSRSRQAFHDSVTGLPGAALLEDRLEQALAEGARSGQLVAVALVDLDQHDAVLQQHGPAAADALLVLAADRLAACVRDGDTLAQLAGPRFVVVWRGVRSAADADELAARLRAAFTTPFPLAEATVEVTVTIGVAVDEWAQTGEELLLAAAAAVHDALRRGPGQLQLAQPATDATRPRTEAALREAMFRDELVVHYQPVVDLTRGVVVGVEALVRWQHPTDGLLGPDCFIPVAESGGLIVALGARVLEQACAQAVRWNAEGLALHVAVNLSMRQVAHPDLVRTVQRTLRSTGLRPSRLVLEVTESAVSEDAAVAATVLGALAELGVHLSIDDFGTGYSSLVYLKSYPVTALKIDRSFVAGMGTCARDDAIVASVLALARAVGGSCIAEGVETPEQYASLVALGCDYGQGWLFGRAVPAHELPDLVVRCEATMAALRQGVVPIPEQPRHRDRRDLEGDQRDEVADRRDAVAERRDDAAQERDHAGDERDELGERRDRAGTRRDQAADLRDLVADERDRAADARDVVADHRDMLAEHGEQLRGHGANGATDRSVTARKDAASDRARASQDRHAGAAERNQSERDRGTALADRGGGEPVSATRRCWTAAPPWPTATPRRASGPRRPSTA